MEYELRQSFSTIDDSITSELNNCEKIFEIKTLESVLNILNLLI